MCLHLPTNLSSDSLITIAFPVEPLRTRETQTLAEYAQPQVPLSSPAAVAAFTSRRPPLLRIELCPKRHSIGPNNTCTRTNCSNDVLGARDVEEGTPVVVYAVGPVPQESVICPNRHPVGSVDSRKPDQCREETGRAVQGPTAPPEDGSGMQHLTSVRLYPEEPPFNSPTQEVAPAERLIPVERCPDATGAREEPRIHLRTERPTLGAPLTPHAGKLRGHGTAYYDATSITVPLDPSHRSTVSIDRASFIGLEMAEVAISTGFIKKRCAPAWARGPMECEDVNDNLVPGDAHRASGTECIVEGEF